ncbi:hypothetical protein [Flavobacterium terrisoli]|uniref:hypothetical protein n=1 Tax=Flavobacterium terrisoli TaxID=3242195 RepID=UPI002542A695|nr:hypothetical protein [Flavobacterium buctense]
MKYKIILAICVFSISIGKIQAQNQNIITSDIDNFWVAYDKIVTTKDTTLQKEYITKLYIEKGTSGLTNIMIARRYDSKSYVDVINNYPLFWNSIRENTFKSKSLSKELELGIDKLKAIYPNLKPAKIYFTIGAFRTPGTIMDGSVLIGSEMALGDENIVSHEFPKKLDYFTNYLKQNPIKNVVFLNIHEYVHTQQKTEGGYDLLSQSLFEGIAEFIPVIALSTKSPTPAIEFGKVNDKKIRNAFENEMFSYWHYNWIWNDLENQFKTRDLGYYVGYAIAEKYYNQSKDKKEAIRKLIELDFNKQDEIEKFVDKTEYFSKSIDELKRNFENSRPFVTSIKEFKNGQQNVNPTLTEITINFSQEMDTRFRSMDFGKLGKEFYPKIISANFSDNGKSVTYIVKLEPNKQYQMLVTDGYRNKSAIQLKPYEINFKTAE